MDEAEFDRYALTYAEQHRKNIALTGEEPEFFAEYKIRLFADWLKPTPSRLLDFGSGIGNSIPHFRKYFDRTQIACADISQKSLDVSSRRFPGSEEILKISNAGIPAPDGSFDAAFSACVFHHIPPSEHLFWLKELNRVVRPGGAIVIFEHNPLNPLTQRAVSTCPFDENAILIRAGKLEAVCEASGLDVAKTRYHVFFPKFVAGLRGLEPLLAWAPIGAQYSVFSRTRS